MNILHLYTRRALKENRVRTWVTIIGVVLSMALFTAVIEGAYSGLCYMRNITIEDSGTYQGYFYDLSEKEAEQAKAASFVRKTARWQEVGWASNGGEIEEKPYFLVDALDGDLGDLVRLKLVFGRLPETNDELILPRQWYNEQDREFVEGESLSLALGSRVSGEETLCFQDAYRGEEEALLIAFSRTYKVVGVYEAFDNQIEIGNRSFYRALTAGKGVGGYQVFFTLQHPYLLRSVLNKQTISDRWNVNGRLMRYYGIVEEDNIAMVLYGLAAILVLLVMFGSISLIYNSFSISVADRTRQLGILKSIGATKKQIRASVRYEALLLAGVGIPVGLLVGCAGIGITLWAIRDVFTALVPNYETKMELVLSPIPLVIAVLICLVTVLISASVPAKRAARLQPIDAIRQSRDVRIKAREVRTSKLTETLFGFEGAMGAKNFKRNRKRYRATVLSLFMSVVLFISASSFCAYLTDSVRTMAGEETFDLLCQLPTEYAPNLMREMKQINGVTRTAFSCKAGGSRLDFGYSAKPEALSDEYHSMPTHRMQSGAADENIDLAVLYLDDETFRAICKENELDPERYFNAEQPTGVLQNEVVEMIRDGSARKWYRYDLLNESALPVEATTRAVIKREGYTWNYRMSDETEVIEYYPNAYVEEQKANAVHGRYELNSERADEILPMADVLETRTYTADAVVKPDGFCLTTDRAAILYPFSALPEAEQKAGTATVFFEAKNHKAVEKEMLNLIEQKGMLDTHVINFAEERENSRMIVGVVNVFAYGFIILISLIAVANVFNTISTNIMLRRREFATLKSIGLGEKGFRRMLNYECVIYGFRALLLGLPVSLLVTFLIHRVIGESLQTGFYVPWYSIAIAIGSVFLVVFVTMLYARHRLRKDNPIDALKNENL